MYKNTTNLSRSGVAVESGSITSARSNGQDRGEEHEAANPATDNQGGEVSTDAVDDTNDIADRRHIADRRRTHEEAVAEASRPLQQRDITEFRDQIHCKLEAIASNVAQLRQDYNQLYQDHNQLYQHVAQLRQDHNQLYQQTNQLYQQANQLYQQAMAFQTLHEGHESSNNAILTFLDTVYNRGLDDQANVQALAQMSLANGIPPEQQQRERDEAAELDLNAEGAMDMGSEEHVGREYTNEGGDVINLLDRRPHDEAFGEENGLDAGRGRAKKMRNGDHAVRFSMSEADGAAQLPDRRRTHEEAFTEDFDLNAQQAKRPRSGVRTKLSIPVESNEASVENDSHRPFNSTTILANADSSTASSRNYGEAKEVAEMRETWHENNLPEWKCGRSRDPGGFENEASVENDSHRPFNSTTLAIADSPPSSSEDYEEGEEAAETVKTEPSKNPEEHSDRHLQQMRTGSKGERESTAAWQEKIDSMLGSLKPAPPPKSYALSGYCSSKRASELSDVQTSAPVTLPDARYDDSSFTTKPMSEECFEEKEMERSGRVYYSLPSPVAYIDFRSRPANQINTHKPPMPPVVISSEILPFPPTISDAFGGKAVIEVNINNKSPKKLVPAPFLDLEDDIQSSDGSSNTRVRGGPRAARAGSTRGNSSYNNRGREEGYTRPAVANRVLFDPNK